ncbi:nucleotide-binding universal stress UspA family protein [Amycolatopsis bartoniae]|uniref:UspA domain-containing protein n=1 Tax=Amycolatopsis bartoniae TaxID=941986 RepID=A0A8H9IM47_9PSEU|nr:universal stress protein [Amycolatopsis bartoniae]MBB2938043.1 nucleotide-binding universal stress UspA family protein [Amycolatopsis bartoniae]TVT09942.1 hypothetical protein FNH07_06750 [Amycolatopsis bartoniae]GHF32312.1 hypothetical protein GCM10017566_01020 [Amycolatopsis bartoniae]
MSLRTHFLPVSEVYEAGQVPFPGPGTIIAGFDGSPGAARALRWAAAEAERRKAALLLVHVFDWPWSGWTPFPAPAIAFSTDVGLVRESLELELVTAAVAAQDAHPGVRIGTAVLDGAPGPVLAALAERLEAAMVVLGAPTSGIVSRVLRGTVADAVVKQCPRPVTVVGGGGRPVR